MTDVVFIHGLWVSHSAWQPWIAHYATQGFRATAPPWPGEQQTVGAARSNPNPQAGYGINELTDYFAALIGHFDTPPVVIGHSFGGLIAQKLLGQNLASAAIAINPAPIKGVRALPLAQLRSAFPVLRNPTNRAKAKALTQSQWRYGFGNALPAKESDALWQQWNIPSPGKPLFEVGIANFTPNSPAKVDVTNNTRGPLLITAGTADHTVPYATAKGAYQLYRKSHAINDFHEFKDRGHSLTIDRGWRDVADTSLSWLAHRVAAH